MLFPQGTARPVTRILLRMKSFYILSNKINPSSNISINRMISLIMNCNLMLALFIIYIYYTLTKVKTGNIAITKNTM